MAAGHSDLGGQEAKMMNTKENVKNQPASELRKQIPRRLPVSEAVAESLSHSPANLETALRDDFLSSSHLPSSLITSLEMTSADTFTFPPRS